MQPSDQYCSDIGDESISCHLQNPHVIFCVWLAGYYTIARRLNDALGSVLAVIKEEGFEDNPIVVFYGGDHGMSFPFAKCNN